MTNDLNLSGPTVTLFGDRDALDDALSDELGRRGCSTHSVSIPVGWLNTVRHAIVRLDTPTGERAMQDLLTTDGPAAHVVATCQTQDDPAVTDRLDELCRRCADHHDVSLIWHSAYSPVGWMEDQVATDTGDLAATIADEVGLQKAWTSAPSFASKVFEPGRQPGAS